MAELPRRRTDPLESLKLPPFSIDAEQSVIGALMVDPQSWEKIADRLHENDFYRRDHRLIFRAIVQLATRQLPLDVITLSDTLKQLGWLDECGGLPYLATLAKETPSAANISAYADIVREKSILRQLIGAGQQIADLAFFPQGRDTLELIETAEQTVFRIADQYRRHGTGLEPVRPLLAKAVDHLDMLYHKGGKITGIGTGFVDLDNLTSGLQASDLIIIAGRPSMGKTTFAMNIAEHVALNEKLPVAVFSMEMSSSQLALRLISSFSRLDQQKVRTGQLDKDEWPRVTQAQQLLGATQMYIDDTPAMTPTEVRARCRRLARDHGGRLGLVVLDYLQLMQSPGAESRVNEISEISRSLKALAKELDVPVIALSQLNRGLEQRPNKRPIMSDLRESGAIEQDADVILFIYRDEVYNKEPSNPNRGIAEIIIAKQRNGPIGDVRLSFLGQHMKFENYIGDSRFPALPESLPPIATSAAPSQVQGFGATAYVVPYGDSFLNTPFTDS